MLTVSLIAWACANAAAFDSSAWEEKRAMHLAEATRLRIAYTNCVARLDSPAEDVSMPLETFDDGSVKSVVMARKAQYFLKSGFVWAEGVMVKRFREGGEVEARVDSANCVVDRASRSGWADGRARVIYGKTSILGSGVYFSSPEQYVRVFDGAEVDSEESRLGAGIGGVTSRAGGRHARIVGKSCDFDREAGVVLFEGGVRVDYAGEYTLCSDRAYAFLAGSNELSRVVAVGNVAITNGLRRGSCAMATYRRRANEIVMYGDSTGVTAHLEDGGKNAGTVDGTRIRFWLDAEQFEVDNSAITVDENGRKGFL